MKFHRLSRKPVPAERSTALVRFTFMKYMDSKDTQTQQTMRTMP